MLVVTELLLFATGALFWQVKQQSKQVWQFIMDREVEAPARFCAIQTHRAVLAIMTSQVICHCNVMLHVQHTPCMLYVKATHVC